MKTVTNMYILQLSIADAMFLIGLPLVITTAVYKHWIFGSAACKVYYILYCINMFTGPFTLTVMSGDRFLAVCYPITSIKYRTPMFAIIACALTWVVSFIFMLPVLMYAQTVPKRNTHYYHTCHITWPNNGPIPAEQAFIWYTLIVGFILPVAIIVFFYACLIARLRNSGPQVKSVGKRRTHRRVTRLVTLIIAVFVICWLPYWAFQVRLIIPGVPQLEKWHIIMFQVFTILSYANSMVNPFLYAFTNEAFRESFISAFRCASDPLFPGKMNQSEYTTALNDTYRNSNRMSMSKKTVETTECDILNLNGSTQDITKNVQPTCEDEVKQPLNGNLVE